MEEGLLVSLSPNTYLTTNTHPFPANYQQNHCPSCFLPASFSHGKKNVSHGQSKWISSCITLMKFYTQTFLLKNVPPLQALNSLEESIYREIRPLSPVDLGMNLSPSTYWLCGLVKLTWPHSRFPYPT